MDKKQRNKSNMYRSVYQMMNEQKSVWENTPQLASTVDKLKQLIDVIEEKREVQESITLDSGLMKSEARDQLSDLVLKGGNLLSSVAKSEEDLETSALLMTTKSALRILDSSKFLAYAKRLDRLITAHLEALVPMGWSEQIQIEFALALEGYNEQVINPRHKMVLRSQATQELKWLFEEVDTLLKNDLDAMVDLLETKSPGFLAAYESSRRIADVFGSKSSEEELGEDIDKDDGEGDSFMGY